MLKAHLLEFFELHVRNCKDLLADPSTRLFHLPAQSNVFSYNELKL